MNSRSHSSIHPSTSSPSVAGLVRMAVLVLEPGLALAGGRHLAEVWVEPVAGQTSRAEQRASGVVQLAAVGVVQANHHVAPGLE